MNHPTKGTCNDAACPQHGRCHCGCGEATGIAPITSRADGYAKGMPRMYRPGHVTRTRSRESFAGAFSKVATVPSSRLAPLVEFLDRRYGGLREAAAVAGIPRGTLYSWQHGDIRVPADRAEQLCQVVLAHRKPRAPWDVDLDVVRRLPTAQERSNNSVGAAYQRKYRRGA